MGLRAFIESTWFKGLSRGLMIVGAAGAGYAGMVLATVNNRIDNVAADVREIQSTMRSDSAVRDVVAKDVEDFRLSVATEFDQLQKSVSALQSDIATIKGIVQTMRRESVADRFEPFTSGSSARAPWASF